MKLQGSCHCGAVRFQLESSTPQPYQRCYCSICRKTAGGGGYAINIMGEADTLEVQGREAVRIYHARMPGGERSTGRRHFCGECGSALWIWSPEWPQWVYPFASAIDTPLPMPVERVHMMLDFAASWVELRQGPREVHVPAYPEQSIEDWHRQRGVYRP